MNKYQPNTKQSGEALELLSQLENNSVSLVFLDPQYEKVGDVSRVKDWPLFYQSDYQILKILEQVERVLKPSGFALLWISKEILNSDRVQLWLIKTPQLKMVDLLVWSKNNFGFGSYLRNQAEFAYLLQKNPTNSKKFKNRGIGNVWSESSLAVSKRNHPHQKPRGLIRVLIEATTDKGELVVDPCAGSFIVLEVCQETEREFMGVDLTYEELREFNQSRIKAKPNIREKA